MSKRELELGVKELLDVRAAHEDRLGLWLTVPALEGAYTSWYDSGVDDLDARLASPVAARQIVICFGRVSCSSGRARDMQTRTHLLHSVAQSHVTELLVHVVCTTAAVVLDGDAVVLHGVRVALADLCYAQISTTAARCARTWFTARISPVDRFSLRDWCKKYQKRDLA